MYDATPLQIIAHGFVPAPTGPGPVTGAVFEGVSLVTRLGPGVTQIILDTGLPGGGSVALEDIRITITPETPTPLVGPPFPVTVDALAGEATPPPTGTGATFIFVHTWNAVTLTLVDNGYWFVISRPGASETT
jgi:hypothetical protein